MLVVLLGTLVRGLVVRELVVREDGGFVERGEGHFWFVVVSQNHVVSYLG